MISLELPSKVFVTHYSSNKGTSMPFKKLCEICSKSNEFADDLLNHATVDIDAYSEFLSLTAPIITSEKKQFKENCSVLKISELMNVTEEAFALLVMENCFKHWKFLAESRLRKFHEKGNRPMCRGISKEVRTSSSTPCESPPSSSPSSSSSLSCSLLTQEENAAAGASFDLGGKNQTQPQTGAPSDDENESVSEDNDGDDSSKVGPGYLYQYSQIRSKDNKIYFGHWTNRGKIRFNEIVTRVITERKVRNKFEEHLRSHYKEQVNQSPLTLKRKRSSKGGDNDSEDMKVVVIDLFSD